MSLAEIKWHPDRKELRNFAIVTLIAPAVISVLLYFLKGLPIQWCAIICAGGLIVFLSSFVSIKTTRIIYLSLILITLPIGYIVSFILLAAFYFLLLTPVGFAFRLLGRDPLGRKFDPEADSYWIAHQPPEGLDRYFHRF